MTIFDNERSDQRRKEVRKFIEKINFGNMLTLDELNDMLYDLGHLVLDCVEILESWKNVVERMMVKR